MKKAFYWLWQWTWGLPQNLAGLFVFLRFAKRPHFSYQGAVATVWPNKTGSMSLGMFLFLYDGWEPSDHALLAHEYGHTIQSLLLGPLYLAVIGLPSIVWAGFKPVVKLRRRKQLPYSWLFCERWADRNGRKYAKTAPHIKETAEKAIE